MALLCPKMVRDNELLGIWKMYWKDNRQWLFAERLPGDQVKRLFDDHIENMMAQEAKALELVFQFEDWDERTEFVFRPSN